MKQARGNDSLLRHQPWNPSKQVLLLKRQLRHAARALRCALGVAEEWTKALAVPWRRDKVSATGSAKRLAPREPERSCRGQGFGRARIRASRTSVRADGAQTPKRSAGDGGGESNPNRGVRGNVPADGSAPRGGRRPTLRSKCAATTPSSGTSLAPSATA